MSVMGVGIQIQKEDNLWRTSTGAGVSTSGIAQARRAVCPSEMILHCDVKSILRAPDKACGKTAGVNFSLEKGGK